MAAGGVRKNIVIIGGGIQGCTTAYFISRHPAYDPDLHRVTILEAADIASGASGKAGGLLGLWAFPQCLVPLSYKLHAELAQQHDGAQRWGYRELTCGSIRGRVKRSRLEELKRGLANPLPTPAPSEADEEPKDEGKDWAKLPKMQSRAAALLNKSPLPDDLDWLDGTSIDAYDVMSRGPTAPTAQVHPYLFTTSMATLAQERGVDIRIGAKATDIKHDDSSVRSVEFLDRKTNTTHVIDDVTDVLVSAGPWTNVLLPGSGIANQRAHSVVFSADVSPYAVFMKFRLPEGFVPEHRAATGQRRMHKLTVDPEVYARPGGEVYSCGETDEVVPLPETADLVECDEARCDDLAAYLSTISPVLAAAPIKAKQACYLPQHTGGYGLVGRTPVSGLWIAAGHTCWGIQNGPATGKLMSEFIMDGEAKSADISDLDPMQYNIMGTKDGTG